MKLFLDYKAAHKPELTKGDPSTKEVFDNDLKKAQTAIGTADSDSVIRLYEQLRTDALALTARASIPAPTGTADSTGTVRPEDSPAGQRVLEGVVNLAPGELRDEPSSPYAPTGMPTRAETNRIIFHHSASNFGDAASIDRWHRENGSRCIGYHFVIPRVGKWQVGRKLQLIGAHTLGRNTDSIGVCIVGHLGNYPPTGSQDAECMRLYHDLCRLYSKTLAIEFHHEECPGKHLDRLTFADMLSDAIA